MINKEIQNAINEQIKQELASAYLYLSMAAYFEAGNLAGFGKWMRAQAKEEQGHAMKFFDYLLDRGGRVDLKALEQPQQEWDNPLAVFEDVLDHEKKVTGLIHKLYELALRENDYATQMHLQWFITEQVEEEKNAAQIVEQLKLIDARGTAILFLDKQLSKRGEG